MRAAGIVALALALALGTSVPAAGGEAPGGTPTLMDLARPRAPFSLAERTGRGQLLFDIGVIGDFIASFTSREVGRDHTGTFQGRENRLFPREIELSLFGHIDPYARGEVRLEAAEEFEAGEREVHVGLAEAHLTLLTLPLDTQLRLGLMRARWGLLNERHQHDLPQPDRPNVLRRFFGEEQLVEGGAELTWVAPLPFYLETLVGHESLNYFLRWFVLTMAGSVEIAQGARRRPLLGPAARAARRP